MALLLATPADAADPVPDESLTSLEVHGFVSQGFILTMHNEWLAEDSKRGSFEFSEVGVNFTKKLTETLQLGVQLFAQDFGPSGNYAPRFDWFYADYRWQDWLGLRVGRLKIPYGPCSRRPAWSSTVSRVCRHSARSIIDCSWAPCSSIPTH